MLYRSEARSARLLRVHSMLTEAVGSADCRVKILALRILEHQGRVIRDLELGHRSVCSRMAEEVAGGAAYGEHAPAR